MKTKKRYVLCGLSTRGIYHLAHPLLGLNREGGPDFSGTSDLAGILDIDRVRVETNPPMSHAGRRWIPHYCDTSHRWTGSTLT
jgi:hypothetical protein